MFLSSHLTIIAFHEQFEVMSPTALLELLLIIPTHVPTAHSRSCDHTPQRVKRSWSHLLLHTAD